MHSNNYITRPPPEVRKNTDLDSNNKYLKTAPGNCANGLIQNIPVTANQHIYIWKSPKYIFVIMEFIKLVNHAVSL
jgi:hypothetical protein